MQIEVRLVAEYEIPDGAEALYAKDGRTVGYRLPNGTVVHPIVAFEVYENEDSDGEDISHDLDLAKLGILNESFSRECEEVDASDDTWN